MFIDREDTLQAVDFEFADLGLLVLAATEQTYGWSDRVVVDPSLGFEVVETSYGGHALQATKHIPAGTVLFRMTGRVFPVEVLNKEQLQHALQIDEGWYHVSSWPFFENFLEHGFPPNGFLHFCNDDIHDPDIWYTTVVDIEPGQKLSFDYACTEWSLDTAHEQGAFHEAAEDGTPGEWVAGFAHLSRARRQAINPAHLSPFIRRRAALAP